MNFQLIILPLATSSVSIIAPIALLWTATEHQTLKRENDTAGK